MADYATLATQTAGGVPGSSWANLLKDNQEAVAKPPSCRFVTWYTHEIATAVSGNDATVPSPSVAGNAATVWCAPKGGRGDTLAIAAFSTNPSSTVYAWQRDYGGTETLDSEPFVDTGNNGYAGSTLTNGGNNISTTDSFAVPRDGTYWCDVRFTASLTNTAGTITPEINGTTKLWEYASYGDSAGGGTKAASWSGMLELTTSDQLRWLMNVQTGGDGPRIGWFSMIRVGV